MSKSTALPKTLEEAHALIAERDTLIAKRDERIAALSSMNTRLEQENAYLEHQVEMHAKRLFGKSSESLDPAQLRLVFAEIEAESPTQESDAADEVAVKGHRRKRTGRTRFSEDLPRERVDIDLDDTSCPCCEKPMEKIGEDVSERLDYTPASFRVIETVRPKYACGTCKQGVHSAPPPAAPIPKGKATASTLAHVAVSKFSDHLPLHRQVGIFKRFGVEISKQTLGGWIRQTSELLAPIARAQWRSVTSSHVILADETPVKVLVKGRKQSKRAYLWAYLGDRDEVCFDFSMGRGSAAPLAALSDFDKGVLLTDAYVGYDEFVRRRPKVSRTGCWAHARRYVHEAKDQDPDQAMPILAMMSRLFGIEREIEKAGEDEARKTELRRRRRDERSRPLIEKLEARLHALADQVLPKSPMGKAVRYALGNWKVLTTYLDDPRVPMTNNAVERQMRVVAVGRNNWTFCGSENGGRYAACFYSLLNTCKLQGIDPHAWLADVLMRLRSHPEDKVDELTPRIWARERTGD